MNKEDLKIYQNSGYDFNRLKKKTITIQLDTSVSTKQYNLQESLIIDTISDIYLDSFITNNTVNTTSNKEIFILGVDEFNIQSVSNASNYNNKIIIPNTHGSTTSESTGVAHTIAHRAAKFNFISTVNPMQISSLNISLTDNSSSPTNISGSAWVTFMFVSRD